MKVKAKHQFQHKGATVKEGEILNLPDYEAESLKTAGHVEPHAEAAQPKSTPSGGGGAGDARGGGRTNPGGN